MRLAWDPVSTLRTFRPDYLLPAGENRISFACRAASPEEVDRTYQEITAADPRSAHTSPWNTHWGHRYATVRDPDGNTVDLCPYRCPA